MILGEASQITLATPDISGCLSFYESTGFLIIDESRMPVPWIMVSDGSVLIRIKQEQESFCGITYFSSVPDETKKLLEKGGIPVKKQFSLGNGVRIIQIESPDGFPIRINEQETAGMYQPTMHTLLSFPEENYRITERYPNKKCGLFGQISHPVKDIYKSIKFWEALGYELHSIHEKPHHRAIMTDGMNHVGLHRSSTIKKISLVYYAHDMAERIKRLEEEGIEVLIGQTDFSKKNSCARIQSPQGIDLLLKEL